MDDLGACGSPLCRFDLLTNLDAVLQCHWPCGKGDYSSLNPARAEAQIRFSVVMQPVQN
jgi:hypothetical protein